VVVVQAGHLNIGNNCAPDLRGGTGAPKERDWTPTIATAIVNRLNEDDIPARLVDANFNCATDVAAVYDAVVSVHYQANLPTISGFFVGAGDPVEDGARDKSARLAQAIFAAYQQATGLPWRPSWNNVNITHYYLFERLASATPFCLIECGVGAPGAPDHDFLWSPEGMEKAVLGIYNGIARYLGKPDYQYPAPPTPAPVPPPGPPPRPAPHPVDQLAQAKALAQQIIEL
jgi:hypothetical protein